MSIEPVSEVRRFKSYGNIRRLFGTTLAPEFVHDTLTSAGYCVERTTHKPHGYRKSNGRWEVRSEGACFEVHLSYKDNKAPPAPLVDTVIQGLKGWKKEVLDHVADSLQGAMETTPMNR